MTQFTTMTSEAKSIVENFIYTQIQKSTLCEPNKQLMASLYSLMPEPDTKVVEILNQYIVSLSDLMSGGDIDTLKAEYPSVIKFCYDYKDYARSINRRDNEQLMPPQSLIDLCIEMAEPKADSSVLIPFSGDGSFAYHLADCKIEGFESNETLWAFSQILLQSQKAHASVKLQKSLDATDKQYDYIFSFPPMLSGRDGREISDTVCTLITKHLANDGELYCILPMSFCSTSAGWFDVRKILSDCHSQYSVLVVSLPPVLQPFSGINPCLLHVKKNNKDIVELMDATGDAFYSRQGVKGNVLNVKSIIETIKCQDKKYVWVGNASQLAGSVNLQPSRYLVSQIVPQPNNGEVSVKLSDVIQFIAPTSHNDNNLQVIESRNRIAHSSFEGYSAHLGDLKEDCAKYYESEKQNYPMVGMKDLSASYLNCDIERDSLSPAPQGIPYYILTTDCLLVGFIGGKFKVGRLHGASQETPVAVRKEIFPIKLSSDIITEDFLLRCIMSEPTEHQANMLSAGSMIISRLNKEDLMSIVICVPTLREQQEALCKEDSRSSLSEADRKIIESYEEFRKDMHMKKHAIGQTLFNLNNWWDALQQARKEGNGVVADDATIGRIKKFSVASVYDSLQKAINQLQQQINKFDRGNGLAVKKFALTEFIEDYIARKQSPLFSFIYDSSEHRASLPLHKTDCNEVVEEVDETENSSIKEGDPIEYVEFAPDALEIIFDDIVSNACSHGFQNRTNKQNFVRIELKTEGDSYVVVLSNNGTAINAQIKPDDVFVYGKTSKMGISSDKGETHFGIGGYEVQKLMREFGGSAEFISTPDSEFPVSYKLKFYNTNL